MSRRAVVALAVLALVVPAGGPARADTRCGAVGRPRARLTYTEDRVTLRVRFSLGQCRGESIFGASYGFTRDDVVTWRYTFGAKFCAGTGLRSCTVAMGMRHPVVERADYNFEVRFPRAGGGHGIYRRSVTCVSAIALRTCEPREGA